MKRNAIICGLLIAATLLVYGRVVSHEFVRYDDPLYVCDNPHVYMGLSAYNIRWAFTEAYAANWHSLTWVSLMLDASITRWLGYNPTTVAGVYHASNLLIHIINVLLVFGVLKMMTGATWRCAIVAGLFALHPTHIESVAWISERKDVLSTMFWWLSIGAYVRYTRAGSYRWYAVTAMCLAMGLLSKPMLVTLPCVLLLLDVWPLGRVRITPGRLEAVTPGITIVSWGRAVLEKLPLLAIVAASCALTIYVQNKDGSLAGTFLLEVPKRLANACVAYGHYLTDLFWPFSLAVFYPHPYYHGQQAPSGTAILGSLAVLVLITVGTGVLLWRGRRGYGLVGWLWFLGTMVPVVGIVQAGFQGRADRYSYLTFIGLYIVLAWGVAELLRRFQAPRAIGGVLAGAVLIALGARSFAHLPVWHDSEALFRNALAVTENNWYVQYGLATTLRKQSREAAGEESRKLRERAMDETWRALDMNPTNHKAMTLLADLMVDSGRHAEAIGYYQKAIAIRPKYVEAHRGWAVALIDLGRTDEGLEMLRHAHALKPRNPQTIEVLVRIYFSLGRYVEAIEVAGSVDEAVRINRRSIEWMAAGATPETLEYIAELERQLELLKAAAP